MSVSIQVHVKAWHMNVYMHRQASKTDACMYGWTDVWMYVWTKKCIDVWTCGCTHGSMDGCMYVCLYVYSIKYTSFFYVGFLDDRRQSHGRAQCVLVLEPCAEVEGMDDASDWHRPIVACKP